MTPDEFLGVITFVEGVKLMHIHESRDHTTVICRRSSIFAENDLFDPCDPYVTFDPILVIVT